jgi:hypothetical protein
MLFGHLQKQCLVCCDLALPDPTYLCVGGLMSYLRYLCLFAKYGSSECYNYITDVLVYKATVTSMAQQFFSYIMARTCLFSMR